MPREAAKCGQGPRNLCGKSRRKIHVVEQRRQKKAGRPAEILSSEHGQGEEPLGVVLLVVWLVGWLTFDEEKAAGELQNFDWEKIQRDKDLLV